MKTIQGDLSFLNLKLHEARELAPNRPLWKLTSLYGATHSVAVHATIGLALLEARMVSSKSPGKLEDFVDKLTYWTKWLGIRLL